MKLNKLALLNIASIVVIVLAIGAAVYFYLQYQNATGAKAAAEVKATVKRVSQIMELPPDETPTIATVSDKSKLAQQDFFKRAENGDKVLIYAKAQKAILYRPSTNKIIDVVPVRTAEPTAQPAATTQTVEPTTVQQDLSLSSPTAAPSPTKAPIINIAMYNGTTKQGLSYKLESVLKTKYQVQVSTRQEAANKDYTRTEVIDISGKYKDQISDIAAFLNADVQNLPKGEVEPEATDILVIIGSDKQ